MKPISAQEFCKFFEWTIEVGNFIDEEDGEKRKYKVTDDMDYFPTMYLNDLSDLTVMMDRSSVYDDYIDNTLYEMGFESNDSNIDFYEQALEWIKGTELENTDTHQVIYAICNPDTLYWE